MDSPDNEQDNLGRDPVEDEGMGDVLAIFCKIGVGIVVAIIAVIGTALYFFFKSHVS